MKASTGGIQVSKIAIKTYEATEIAATGALTYSAEVFVGPSGSDKETGYQRFAAEVEELEALEDGGKIEITNRHHESQSGNRYVDHVQFKKLK